MSVGDRIKDARKRAGFTQASLAREIGVAEITIRQYELGKRQPRLEQLRAIADTLGTSTDYLVGKYQLKGFQEYPTDNMLSAIFEAVRKSGMSNEDFCQKLGLPYDEWFKWKECSSRSYHDYLPEIAEILSLQNELPRWEKWSEPYRQRKLESAFAKLNPSGQREAIKRVTEMSKLSEYRRQDAPQSPPAPQPDTDTPSPEKPPESP